MMGDRRSQVDLYATYPCNEEAEDAGGEEERPEGCVPRGRRYRRLVELPHRNEYWDEENRCVNVAVVGHLERVAVHHVQRLLDEDAVKRDKHAGHHPVQYAGHRQRP